MSYDVSLTMDTGAGNVFDMEVRNVTYNNGVIFAYLGVPLRELEGQLASDVAPRLAAALERMGLERNDIKQIYHDAGMPENWGGFDDARAFLERFLECCEAHPLSRVAMT